MITGLLQIYPDLDLIHTVQVRDDGLGPYIAIWNDPRPQPTAQQLSDALLPAAKQKQILLLKTACKAAIEGGFYSSALGIPYKYDSALPQDQSNLIGAKLAGIDMAFTCTDANGIKWQHLHTAAQISQVYLDGMLHIQTNQALLYSKLTLLAQAITLADIAVIVW